MFVVGWIDNILFDRFLIFLVVDYGCDYFSIFYIFIYVCVYLYMNVNVWIM